MRNFLKGMSLMPKGLKYKLILSFSLMSIIPLLLCLVLMNKYVYHRETIIGNIDLLIFITAFISILGLFISKSMIDSIVKIAQKIKLFDEGKEFKEIEVEKEDEIGGLSASINKMASRLNKNVDTLKSYEQRIRRINLEINKKITALSTLFQVTNVVSTAKELNVILQAVTERLPDIMDCDKSFLVMFDVGGQDIRVKTAYNLTPEEMEALEKDFSKGVLSRLAEQREILISDVTHKSTNVTKNLSDKLNLKNIIIFPIVLHGEVKSIMVLGNDKNDFSFEEDDLDLVRVFSKQISIAIENNWLTKKTEELSVKDELTGLFNLKYLKERLAEEIQRAIIYQRPCSFALFKVDDFNIYQDKYGNKASDEILKKAASILKVNVEQVDKAARFDRCRFALILPEKNKRETHMIADKIRGEIEKFKFMHQESMPGKNLTVSAAVTSNPLDGMSSEELINKAKKLLEAADSKTKNSVFT